MRSEARLQEYRMRLKALSGVMDFFGVIACTILIVAMIALFVNLYSWLRADLTQSFASLQQSVTHAVLVQ